MTFLRLAISFLVVFILVASCIVQEIKKLSDNVN